MELSAARVGRTVGVKAEHLAEFACVRRHNLPEYFYGVRNIDYIRFVFGNFIAPKPTSIVGPAVALPFGSAIVARGVRNTSGWVIETNFFGGSIVERDAGFTSFPSEDLPGVDCSGQGNFFRRVRQAPAG